MHLYSEPLLAEIAAVCLLRYLTTGYAHSHLDTKIFSYPFFNKKKHSSTGHQGIC